MSGWDAGQVFYSDQGLGANGADGQQDVFVEAVVEQKFASFIREFRVGNTYTYKQQLRQHCILGDKYIDIDVGHLRSYDEKLVNELAETPERILPCFDKAALKVYREIEYLHEQKRLKELKEKGVEINSSEEHIANTEAIQVVLTGAGDITVPIRDLVSNHVGKLVQVSGIVISATRPQAKVTMLALRCRSCESRKNIRVAAGMSSTMLPRKCAASAESQGAAVGGATGSKDCGFDPYDILGDQSDYVDQQTLKMQESPESIPTGEMPRHLRLVCERYMSGRAVPGARITAIGVYTIDQGGEKKRGRSAGVSTVKNPYVQVVGMRVNDSEEGRSSYIFTPEEETAFVTLSRRPHVYDAITKSIAPAIYGHEDIKRAIACQLFGGARKSLPDGMKLRGDINLLLLGDPGTAKSQFLKFVEKIAPIGVYTSGKGSSAAGLTASIIRDPATREFYLEGGAMVLADGGVVCIDEFDKMHVGDRVAIHEAMEQQTISIAKAGITTILNTRTSVLAAANPVFGSYDDTKSAFENIEFQSTILSRFDLIFIVRDRRNEAKDKRIAEHVMGVHMQNIDEQTRPEIDPSLLKRYISYARVKCFPRLSEEAAKVLEDHYVSIRSSMRQREVDGEGNAIPITVRQLEAIVRVSESLARMSLSPQATVNHVNEAIRLFKVSTVEAASSGVSGPENLTPEVLAEISRVEALLKRRLPIGSRTSQQRICEDFQARGVASNVVAKAISIMVSRDELEYRNQRKIVYRKR